MQKRQLTFFIVHNVFLVFLLFFLTTLQDHVIFASLKRIQYIIDIFVTRSPTDRTKMFISSRDLSLIAKKNNKQNEFDFHLIYLFIH